MSAQQQDLRQIYHHIIDDVVAKMKPGFLQESVDESVLQTIRQRWSQKLTEKGIISEPEPQPEPAPPKKEDDSASRKRPYDGSAPNNRQEAAAAAAGGMPPVVGLNMPMKGPPPHMQMRPQGQGMGPGMRPAHPQMAMGRGVGPGGMAAGQQLQLPANTQMLVQTALQSVQNLPAHQQHAAFQAQLQLISRNAQAQLRAQGMSAGIPSQAQMAGMQQLNQGMAAAQQLQGLRAPGLPPNVMAAQNLQQQVLQHQMMQQQVLQQQQQQQQQQRMQGLPPGVPPNIQGLLQQQGVVQRIPQGDGSADMSPSVAEVAAAAGMPPERLRAMLPRRIAAIMDRSRTDSSRSIAPACAAGPMQSPVAAQAAGAATEPVAAAAGSSAARPSASNRRQPRRRQRGVIPQLDGEGDDEEDYAGDYEGDDVGDGGADEGDEEEVEDEDTEGESDDPELDKFTAELDELEEADKEETGDVGFALYEKVHRAKNRWRCNLRYGVFLINNKEYMFNKGSTDFTF